MTISQPTPTNEYRWIMQDRKEVLQQRWSDGEWRTAPDDAPKPPKIFDSEP